MAFNSVTKLFTSVFAPKDAEVPRDQIIDVDNVDKSSISKEMLDELSNGKGDDD